MARKVEGQERYPGPSRHVDAHTASYQQAGDMAFKSPMSPPAVTGKPVGVGMKGDAASGRDTYTGLPGDGITPR